MRAFRVRQRNPRTNRIEKHRDYVGLEKFMKHGIETYNRYMSYREWTWKVPDKERKNYLAEICEKKDGEWVKLTREEVVDLISGNDMKVTPEWLVSNGFGVNEGPIMRSFSKSISFFEEEYKVLTVCIDPGNVYVYIRQGERKAPREKDDMVTVFNGDRQGTLTKDFIETLYNLLTLKR